MPLFGKPKSPLEKVAKERKQLIDLVNRFEQKQISQQQLEDGFYKVVKKVFPVAWMIDENIKEALSTPPETGSPIQDVYLRDSSTYAITFNKVMQRLLNEYGIHTPRAVVRSNPPIKKPQAPQKSREERIADTKVNLLIQVVKFLDGEMNQQQFENNFYKAIKNGFPAAWYAAEDVRYFMVSREGFDHSSLSPMETELLYQTYFAQFNKAVNKLIAEQR